MNRIHFLRACWSDIILVESGGRFALIDTGFAEAFELISAYLERLGVQRLEWILITHFHRDHYGSLPALLEHWQVDRVYMKKFSGLVVNDGSGRSASAEFNERELANCESMCAMAAKASELMVIRAGVDRVRLGDFDFRIFGAEEAIQEMYHDPDSPYYGQIRFGENTNSTALFAEVDGTAVYLGGDAGNEALDDPRFDRPNTRYARAVGKPIDLYKVPHHGCGNLFGDGVLEILQPRFSVVTNWEPTLNRRFTENRDRLLAARPGAQVLCCEHCGYAFTLGPDGQLEYEKINQVPEITPEEVPQEEHEAFREIWLRHLAEDGILMDRRDPDFYAGDEAWEIFSGRRPQEGSRCRLFTFRQEGKRIGAAICRMDEAAGGRCLIEDFWIFAPYRSKGAGHYCWEALEACCSAAGAGYYLIHCEKPEVVRFWKAFGFTEDGANERGMPRFRLF